VTLAELAAALDTAKSSVQELTNGLLARGYLIESERRFHLGPGPFILAARANKLAAVSLDHEFVAELAKVLGCTVLVGVRLGDAIVFTDLVGEESPSLTFVARTTPVARSTQAPPERLCWRTSPTTRCTASSTWRVRSRQVRSDNSSPSFPRSACADSPLIGELRSRTRSPWPRRCWRLILINAPSGYGKSTLAAQWREFLMREGVAVAC
jgi:hypothetical protein